MKTRTRSVASVIIASVFCCASATASAMPKAAEDESAQVSSGIDSARPKHSSAKPPPAAGKAKPAKKPAKSKASPNKPKSTHSHK